MSKTVALLALLGGVVIALITGLVPGVLLVTRTQFSVIAGSLLGASNYGLPIVWRTVIVYPGSPVNYHVGGLVVDIVVWMIVAWLFLKIGSMRGK